MAKRILMINHDSAIHHMLEIILAGDVRLNFTRVFSFMHAINELLSAKDIGLIISDFALDTEDAIGFVSKLHQLQIDVPVVVLTGFLEDDQRETLISLGVRKIYSMPFNDLSSFEEDILSIMEERI